MTSAQRSANMRAIHSRDTKPEMMVRRLLFAAGFRYRLQRRDLPGTPDIVLSKYRTVIFVNGCFWHHHPGCTRAAIPQTRQDYWLPKIARNIERDKENISELKRQNWRVLVVWECACRKKNEEALKEKIFSFILSDRLEMQIGKSIAPES